MLGMQESTRLADTVAQSPDTLRADCRAPADFCMMQLHSETLMVTSAMTACQERFGYHTSDQPGIKAFSSRSTLSKIVQRVHHLRQALVCAASLQRLYLCEDSPRMIVVCTLLSFLLWLTPLKPAISGRHILLHKQTFSDITTLQESAIQ